ncbi:hypothetical protein Hamer_G014453, partial [Homarus americanus]
MTRRWSVWWVASWACVTLLALHLPCLVVGDASITSTTTTFPRPVECAPSNYGTVVEAESEEWCTKVVQLTSLPDFCLQDLQDHHTNVTFTLVNTNTSSSNVSIQRHKVVGDKVEIYLKASQAGRYFIYCSNEQGDSDSFNELVRVGYKPLDVASWWCCYYNWQMLQCQWSMPYNPAQTRDYQPYLVISLSSSISRRRIQDTEEDITGGKNIPNVYLLPSVLPDPVSNLTLEAAETGRVLRAEWSTPQPLIQFPANLTYRVDYRLADSTCSACSWTTGDVGECNSERCEATVEVEYWGQQYLVCVRLRSGAATYTLDDDIWWSKCSNMNTDTPPSVPDSSPVVGPGTFQVSNNIPELRDLTLAWQLVPPLLHNGPNFSYVVVAENSEGRSSVTSVVKVEATSDLPDPPVLPVVVYHQQQHLYELRWSNESELGNRYTVYVCMDDLKNSAPC